MRPARGRHVSARVLFRRLPFRRLRGRVPAAVAVILLAGTATACAVPTASRGRTLRLQAGAERLAVTVTRVADPARPARPLYTPQPSDRVVAVTVRLANRGTVPAVVYPAVDSTLGDGAGQSFHTVAFPTKAGSLFATGALHLPPNHTASGVVTFVVPTSATGLRYAFSLADGFRSASAQWTLR